MIKTEKEYDILYMSPSSLATFARCPAKFLFQHVLRLQARGQRTLAMDFGSCIHAAIPYCYIDVNQAVKVFLTEWQKFPHGESDPKRNSVVAGNLLHYHANLMKQRNPVYTPIDPPQGTIEVTNKYSDFESPFLVAVGGNYLLHGKIDRFVRRFVDKQLYVLDYKTAARLGETYFDNFEVCYQGLAYTLVGEYLTGEEIAGFAICALRTGKNVESIQRFYAHNEIQKKHFIEEMKGLMELVSLYNKNKCFPKRFAGCSTYQAYATASYKCPYHALCMQCDSESWVEYTRFYDKSDFNPLKKETLEELKENQNEHQVQP